MGVSFRAYTTIGVVVPKSKLYRTNRMRGCVHALPDQGSWCPQCGQKVWLEDQEPIPEFLPDGSRENDWTPTVAGLPCIIARDSDEVIAGVTVLAARGGDRHDPHLVMGTPPDAGEVRERLKAALEPLGLWDESKFGVWLLADVSY